MPIGSFIRSGGLDIKYEATENVKLDTEKVFALYENGEISRDQLLRMISISKSEAKKIIGGDQVAEFEITVTGDSADIRIENTPLEYIDEEYIGVMVKEKPKRRRRIGRRAKPTTKTPARKRKIKTRG